MQGHRSVLEGRRAVCGCDRAEPGSDAIATVSPPLGRCRQPVARLSTRVVRPHAELELGNTFPTTLSTMAIEDVLPTIILVAVIFFAYRWLTGSSEWSAEAGAACEGRLGSAAAPHLPTPITPRHRQPARNAARGHRRKSYIIPQC